MAMTIAIVLAAGMGNRFGDVRPKQFFIINDRPIISYTLENLEKCCDIDAVEIVCRSEYLNELKEIKQKYGFKKIRWFVEGGETFQYSFINGINYLVDNSLCEYDDIIQMHLAANPTMTDDVIRDSIRVCKQFGNAFAGEPDRYPLCISNDGVTGTRTLNSEGPIFRLDPPWSFKAGEIYELYKRAKEDGILNKLEPRTPSVFSAYGLTMHFSKYPVNNIKITTKDDAMLFKALLDSNL